MEINPAAGRHGVSDSDIAHIVHNSVVAFELDHHRVLYLGPDSAGNLHEVVTITFDDGTEEAIHAMKMRPKYRRYLPKK